MSDQQYPCLCGFPICIAIYSRNWILIEEVCQNTTYTVPSHCVRNMFSSFLTDEGAIILRILMLSIEYIHTIDYGGLGPHIFITQV